MAKGRRKDKTVKSSDAAKRKLLTDSPAPSVSESLDVEQAEDPAVDLTSELSEHERVVDQQHKKEEIYEPPAVSDIIVQR